VVAIIHNVVLFGPLHCKSTHEIGFFTETKKRWSVTDGSLPEVNQGSVVVLLSESGVQIYTGSVGVRAGLT
jgi:hypothetical protein